MQIQLLAAAFTSTPLGAPGIVSITSDTSTALGGNTAGIVFGSNGAFSKYRFGVPIHDSYWLTPQENMGDYEIRATLSSGDTPTGTFGSWETLDTTRSWELSTAIIADEVEAAVLIEIRWTGNSVVQDSATYTLTAEGPAS